MTDDALRAALEAAVMANQKAWAAPRSESASGCPNLACGLDCWDCNGTGMIWDQDMIADHAAKMTIAAFRKALDERGLRITAIDLNANDEFAAGWRNGMRLGRRLALTGHQGGLGGNPLRVTQEQKGTTITRDHIRRVAEVLADNDFVWRRRTIDDALKAGKLFCCECARQLVWGETFAQRAGAFVCYRHILATEASQDAQDEQLMLEATDIPYKRPSPTAEPENADLGVSIARAIAQSKP